MHKQLIHPHDAAERLNINKRSIYELLSPGGRLHHLRVQIAPRIVRIDPEGFEEYLKNAGVRNSATD